MTRGRRPELDGVRGLAILLVLVGHGGANHRLGGLAAAGVTLFFALSGYLITTLLITERERTGRLDLRRFYLRRMTRLAPPVVFLMVVYTNVWGFPGWRTVLAPLTWTANYVRLSGVELYPFDHTWSLGVEEQFYLLWPLALGLVLTRWNPVRVVGWAVFALLVWRGLAMEQGHLIYAYGTMECAGSTLLAGALVAVARWKVRGWWAAVALASIVAAGLGSALVADGWLMVPLLVTPSCALLVAAPARWLAFKPLAWCGIVSYSVYLWHEPVTMMVTHGYTFTGVGLGALAGVGAYLLVERPLARARALGLDWRGRQATRSTSNQAESAPGESSVVPPALKAMIQSSM